MPAPPMPSTSVPDRRPSWRRHAARLLALALLCALLHALLPAYTLGTALLPPLSVVLGVAAAAAVARGPFTVPAAVAGVLAADIGLRGMAWPPALAAALLLGLQALVVTWPLRRQADADLLQFDTWPRLKRLVLEAAPLAAAVGTVGALLLQIGTDPGSAFGRPQLAGMVGRFIADVAGIVVTLPVLLCWLGRPATAWWPCRCCWWWPRCCRASMSWPAATSAAWRCSSTARPTCAGCVCNSCWPRRWMPC
jgi:hypothetical protein